MFLYRRISDPLLIYIKTMNHNVCITLQGDTERDRIQALHRAGRPMNIAIIFQNVLTFSNGLSQQYYNCSRTRARVHVNL